MKKIIILLFIVLLSIAAFWLLSQHHKMAVSGQHEQAKKVMSFSATSTVTPSQSMSAYKKYSTPNTVSSVVHTQSENKSEVIQALIEAENLKSLDTYGKVIDQYGNPVVGAKVKAGIGLSIDFTHSGGKDLYTETDSEGRFKFVGIHGAGVAFTPQKQGYIIDGQQSRAKNYDPDPDHPLILKMWKLKGAELMVHAHMHDYIPCDGNVTRYNFLTGKQSSNGELEIKLIRNPVNINRGTPFDWTLTISVLSGGLIEENDLYPYEAPESGYQPSIIVVMPKATQNWTSSFQKDYYLKFNGGIYGRISIQVDTDFQPPPTNFRADAYVNPSGSRNLEP